MIPSDLPIPYYRYKPGGWETVEAGVISEAAVTLHVNGENWLTFLCTPANLEALAVGFLFNEDIIHSMEDVASVRLCDQASNVDVWLRRSVEKPTHWQRTSGCAGGATRADLPVEVFENRPDFMISPQDVIAGMEQLFRAQELYHQVRGVHCSGLSDGKEIRILAEDIGRHNTLDKIAGLLLMEHPEFGQRMVLTTGRVSSEMLQKSARLGARVVVSRTSPTSLSIQFAQELGITLVGYARHSQFNVYAHPERLGYSNGKVPAGILSQEAG